MRGACDRVEHLALGVEHAGFAPLPEQSSQCAILNTLFSHAPHPVMLDGIKALLDVRCHHPGLSSALARDGPCIHGVQGANLGAISVTTAPEVLRVDGFAETRHCSLQERIFHGGYSQRTLRAIACGHRGSSDECGPVPLRLQALYERVDICVQVLLLGLGAHLIHPGGGILADVPPALGEEVLIAPPVEGTEPIALLTCSLLCSSLQGGWHCGSDPSRAGHVSCAGCVCLSAPSPCARLSRLRVL